MTAQFDNRFFRELPGESLQDSRPHQVFGAAYSPVNPTAVADPKLLAWNQDLGRQLGLTAPETDHSDWVQALAGNALLPEMQPYAMCYGGHQFGHWAGQLGDGRVINLGEMIASDGARWEIQLKGAGPTPYSRTADGRAVLRSSLREYLCSEAMHALGVPTSRALSLIATGDSVVRDMFYDGRAAAEPGAIVCRLAPSFLRFGSFELPASRKDLALLQTLVNYTVQHHFPEFWSGHADIAGWFREICLRTARLMVEWERVGFVHGVMNTDNMSIHGITIDYGPYGWMEPYDPGWTPNTTDAEGRRYCFGNQPAIGQWNLVCLGQALSVLVEDAEPLQQALVDYANEFHAARERSFARKLGLQALSDKDPLLEDLFALLRRQETDYCITFRQLAKLGFVVDVDASVSAEDIECILPAFYSTPDHDLLADWRRWLENYRARLAADGVAPGERVSLMNSVNPLFVPRNYLAQQAIEAATLGDASELERLLRVLQKPYEDQPEFARYAGRRPEWARHKAGCSALSCSS